MCLIYGARTSNKFGDVHVVSKIDEETKATEALNGPLGNEESSRRSGETRSFELEISVN